MGKVIDTVKKRKKLMKEGKSDINIWKQILDVLFPYQKGEQLLILPVQYDKISFTSLLRTKKIRFMEYDSTKNILFIIVETIVEKSPEQIMVDLYQVKQDIFIKLEKQKKVEPEMGKVFWEISRYWETVIFSWIQFLKDHSFEEYKRVVLSIERDEYNGFLPNLNNIEVASSDIKEEEKTPMTENLFQEEDMEKLQKIIESLTPEDLLKIQQAAQNVIKKHEKKEQVSENL